MSKRIITAGEKSIYTKREWNLNKHIRIYPPEKHMTGQQFAVIIADDNKFEGL